MMYANRFLHFWYNFIVGNDWSIAIGIIDLGGIEVGTGVQLQLEAKISSRAKHANPQ